MNFRFLPTVSVLALSLFLTTTAPTLPLLAQDNTNTITNLNSSPASKGKLVTGQIPPWVFNQYSNSKFTKVLIKDVPNGGGQRQAYHSALKEVLKNGSTRLIVTISDQVTYNTFAYLEFRIAKNGQVSLFKGYNSANKDIAVRIEQDTKSLSVVTLKKNSGGKQVTITPGSSKSLGRLNLNKKPVNIAAETSFKQ